MSLIKKIKDFFSPEYIPKEYPKKTLKELGVIDTVWILDHNKELFEGWIFDINKKHIIVTVSKEDGTSVDYRFTLTRPLSQTELHQNNQILFLNKPCESEVLSSFHQMEDM